MWRWGVSALLTLGGLLAAWAAGNGGAWFYGRMFRCGPPPKVAPGQPDTGVLPQCSDQLYILVAAASAIVAVWFLLWMFTRYRFQKSGRNPLLWRVPLTAFALFLPIAAWLGWRAYTTYW